MIRLFSFFFILLFLATSPVRSDIVYSTFEGTIEPRVGSADPFGLGSSKSFAATFTLQNNRSDLDSVSQRATYQILATSIQIDGTAAIVNTSGFATFTDNNTQGFDTILFGSGNLVSFNGGTSDVPFFAELDSSTFSFSNNFESAPTIVAVPVLGGSIIGSSYQIDQLIGSTINSTSIPEPTSATFFLFAIAAVLRVRNRVVI